jgi:hypothetical protein
MNQLHERRHRVAPRAAIVLGVLAVVFAAPGPASARCLVVPFDKVIRTSDAVLVGTIADAKAVGPHKTSIVVRLDVESALKGTASDGDSVSVSGCGPPITGSAADAYAESLIGTRDLYLLTRYRDGTVSTFGDVTSPQGMTLDQRIARARDLLGIQEDSTSSLWPWLGGALALALVAAVGVAVLMVRRRRRA